MKKLLVITAMVGLTACSSSSDLNDAVLNRASFDFDCPKSELQIQQTSSSGGIAEALVGVSGTNEFQVKGCGQRQSFKARHQGFGDASVTAIGTRTVTEQETSN